MHGLIFGEERNVFCVTLFTEESNNLVKEIEITSWKVRAYDVYSRVASLPSHAFMHSKPGRSARPPFMNTFIASQ